jgi:branched-chain amino acid transport system ATP-binding protein
LAILEVRGLYKFFGGLAAIRDVSMEIGEGELLSVIGPNGAGKTTLFNLITGILPFDKGNIFFNGSEITGLKSHSIARLGIGRTFQSTNLFEDKSVFETLLIGHHCITRSGVWDALLKTTLWQKEEVWIREKSREVLEFVNLTAYENELAKNIPTEAQKRLAMALVLVRDPKLIFLDEPMGGMNVEESMELAHLVQRIKQKGITVCLIEHKMRVVMHISDRIVVLNYGEKIAEGPPEKIKKNKDVIEAYLGAEYVA